MHMNKLKPGDNGVIVGFEPDHEAYQHKLLSMGLTPGAAFSVVRVAPLGDPMQIKVRGFHLSLRKSEAAAIQVEKQP